MHPNVERVAAALKELGAAGQLGCPVGAIANSLVFTADGEPLLVMTSGAHRVGTARVAAPVGADRVGRATPEIAREATSGFITPTGTPTAASTSSAGLWTRRSRRWAAPTPG